MNKIELLAPAGNLTKLKYAIRYGADAVYLGGQVFGLRAKAQNFTIEEMEKGIKFAHDRGKRVFLTLNIVPHNADIKKLEDYLMKVSKLDFDAVIVSDPGILTFVKEHWPEVDIHLSTQANNTNYASANFWYNQGVKRIILARELSIKEITEMREKTDPNVELEAFIHGAMCISYSGRCLLSNYMANRDSNRGACAQPCRWEYHLMEETREGEYMPVFEDERGTYIYNSKDLCLINHIPELIESGLSSLKIEGRMKSLYYVANVVRAYREAIDSYYRDKKTYKFKKEWLEELEKSSHRQYTEGFYFGKPGEDGQVYETSSYIRTYDFTGIVLDYDEETKMATVEQRNRMFEGDEIEIIGPNYFSHTQKIGLMLNNKGKKINVAPHPQQILKIKMEKPVKKHFILRKRKDD